MILSTQYQHQFQLEKCHRTQSCKGQQLLVSATIDRDKIFNYWRSKQHKSTHCRSSPVQSNCARNNPFVRSKCSQKEECCSRILGNSQCDALKEVMDTESKDNHKSSSCSLNALLNWDFNFIMAMTMLSMMTLEKTIKLFPLN